MTGKVNTSEQVRELNQQGLEVKDIAKQLGIRYQFAYNVISQMVAERKLKEAAELAEAAKQIQPIIGQQALAPIPVAEQVFLPRAIALSAQATIPITASTPLPQRTVHQMTTVDPIRVRSDQQQKAGVLARLFGSK